MNLCRSGRNQSSDSRDPPIGYEGDKGFSESRSSVQETCASVDPPTDDAREHAVQQGLPCVSSSNPGSEPPDSCNPRLHPSHGADDKGGPGSSPSGLWRRSAAGVDQGRATTAAVCPRSGRGGHDCQRRQAEDPLSRGCGQGEQSQPPQVFAGELCPGELQHDGGAQRDDRHDPEAGHGALDGDHPGPDGVREACERHLRGDAEERAAVRGMGKDDSGRGPLFHLPGLGQQGRRDAKEDANGGDDDAQGKTRGRDEGQEGARPDEEHGDRECQQLHREECGDAHQGRAGADERSPRPQGGARDLSSSQDRGEGCPHVEDPGLRMSGNAACALEYKSQLVVPNMFEELIGKDRLEFMEIACEPDSLLTHTFQERAGRSDAACRSSLWCGHDLSKPEGLNLVLEQIYTLRPKHVWISPPCGPYSPLQNTNQRSPAQIQELKAKRLVANRIYESTMMIVKTCVQLGIHVSVELAERCEAWRLPIFQKLRFDMGLCTGVCKGCAVGLRSTDGQLMQKGWRIVTSHRRLSEVLHKPCMCPTNYKHGRCEGKNATSSGHYTKEFARLVYEGLSREGNFSQIVSECSGRSELPEGFGLGLSCLCQGNTGECGACSLQDLEHDGNQEVSKTEMSDPKQDSTLNQQAQNHLNQDHAHKLDNLHELLKAHPLKTHGRSRRNQETSQDYHTFGTYAYGSQYGVTTRTKENQSLCRYVNKILKGVFPEGMRWTSFVINHGTRTPIHRDCNNSHEHPNGSVGFGNYSGGEIWIEGRGSENGRKGKLSVRENGQGERVEGMEFDVKGHPVIFSPRRWHGSCNWKGDRWVLTVFVSRQWDSVSGSELELLKHLGFPIPEGPIHEAYPAEHSEPLRSHEQRKERIKKQLYLLHCASGHSNPRHLEQALKKRGADALTLQLAKEFSCPVCAEKSRPAPRNLAALEPLPPKMATISADVGHWVNPHTHESFQFMLVIDEGSRFRTARILSEGSRQTPNAPTCLNYLQEGWIQYFGYPRCLRLDPAGVFRSTAVEDWCDKHGIFLDIVPGEAHWKIGTCENAVQGVKNVMAKLSVYDEQLTAREALAEAVATFNHKEIIRGFSPAQHVLGQ